MDRKGPKIYLRKQRPRRRKRLAFLVLSLAALLIVLRWAERDPASAEAPQIEIQPTAQILPAVEAHQTAVAPTAPAVTAPPPVQRSTVRGVIRPGDTVTGLLGELLTPQEIHALSRQSRKVFSLSRICAGQPYELCTLEGELESFAYDVSREEQLVVRREEEGFAVTLVPIPYTVETALVQGHIRTSLFEAVDEIGEGPELALALAEIFAWDIDFILDIRQGDSFQAAVERRFRDGEPAGYGRILAAEFVNRGKAFHAVRFQDGDRPPAYYDLDGNSLRKAFLKAPLAFSRISSGFSRRRFHPITKRWKAHPAIDYAAPTGTPVKTVGDGTVAEKGYTNGNGNYLKIRHNSTYETLYLHLRRFARGLKRGQRVTQGQVIGYVGSTGLATGPHLCFRMYKHGSPVNPYKVKSISADPVAPERMAEFREIAADLVGRFGEGGTEQARLPAPPRL
jgi:murein DD-endopeptidase MepM/ murein hydrolase activator NlpD